MYLNLVVLGEVILNYSKMETALFLGYFERLPKFWGGDVGSGVTDGVLGGHIAHLAALGGAFTEKRSPFLNEV